MVQVMQSKIKYKVFFRRVSTITQDLAMQESADALYREKYINKEILILNEDGVSANKLNIEQRPQMKKLINLIINNQVDIIYAFDRTRLFRDFYESNYFVSLCKKHNVDIFFTSSGHQQATDSTLLEGVMNIVSDVEGKNIARRTEEARKRYPPRKLGYIKQKETKQYIKDPSKKDALLQFFSAIKGITSLEHLEATLNEYKRILKTTTKQLLKIAKDPFYAGFDLTNGKNKLSHIEPYLTYEDFKELQAHNNLLLSYQDIERSLNNQDIYDVCCGICRKPMKFHMDIPAKKAWYSCSRKHSKTLIGTEDLILIIKESLEKIIEHLDTELLLKDSRHFFHLIHKNANVELRSLELKKHNVMEKVILETDDFTHWRQNPHYIELTKLEKTQMDFLNQIEEKQALLIENETLVRMVKDYLHKCRKSNPYFLVSMLLGKLYVYPNEVNLMVSKFDYLSDLQTQYVLKGEKLL
ncbi:recombinase family protein [Alkalicoccobacillus porphyridii]|uniref:Recombinase family protein n=1 Tax=Alkalicoccobacillus porphyridii TaxID=2597270 RepID=A0A553ZVS2_9BACI|nr:recombinase family protein [Alkalicoccobacillus porphyridii]TSB45578.1 recombinase family protein [Alkalicoccobacillus porphyridii]